MKSLLGTVSGPTGGDDVASETAVAAIDESGLLRTADVA